MTLVPTRPCKQLHRQTIVLSGTRHWCQQHAQIIAGQCAELDICWLAEAERSLLGQEVDVLIVDAWKGFDPDVFGQATGTIRGGGLLVLLTPVLADWPAYDDPQYARVNVALYPATAARSRFIQYLVDVIQQENHLTLLTQAERLPELDLPVQAVQRDTGRIIATPDQRQAIEAIIKVVTGQRRRPVVLTADRGRGKSAAFGMAAAELLKQGYERIIVSGPSIQAVDALFAHACQQLDGAHRKRGLLVWNSTSITFIPPDELVELDIDTDLLLIDEAAAIPTPILQILLAKFPRIGFATTVHGYEGTGRGFAVRFTETLNRQTRGWRAIKLDTPVRWALNDPVEKLVASMLLLNADAVSAEVIENAHAENCQFEKLDRDELISDRQALVELFGLLVLAHYRTRPFDLRHLLDGPNISVYVMRHAGHIVATALTAIEGGFDANIARQIRLGNRRPHGHLLAEALAAHLGLDQAPQLKCARVIRIAVHPDVQQRGIGTALLQGMIEDSVKQDLDYFGSSFGATRELLGFWQRSDFIPVRLSTRRGTTSGEHSVIVMRGLNDSGKQLAIAARERFERHIFHQLSGPLCKLTPGIAGQLLVSTQVHKQLRLDQADRLDLSDFVQGHRVYETCMGVVYSLVQYSLMHQNAIQNLTVQEQRLLITRVLQGRGWQTSAVISGVEGRRQAVQLLRECVGKLAKLQAVVI